MWEDSLPFGGSPAIWALASVASLCVLILVLILCACHKNTSRRKLSYSSNGDATHASDKTNSTNLSSKENGEPAVCADIQLEAEVSSGVVLRPKSMPPSSEKASKSQKKPHSRVKSQDHRALPEIPSSTQPRVMPTDDEEEDDGHYDVISASRRQRAAAAAAASQHPKAKPSKSPFRRIKTDSDSDSLYAGIKDESVPKASDPPYGGSDSTYAGIRDSSPSASSLDVAATEKIASMEQTTQESAVDVTYAQIEDKKPRIKSPNKADDSLQVYSPAPPVPHKNYDDDSQREQHDAHVHGSPSLPPRNGTADEHLPGAGMAVHLYETPSDPEPSAAVEAMPMVGSAPAGPLVLHADAGAAAAGMQPDATPEGVKEPRYSSVTARESLDNLKRRQAHPLQIQQMQQQQQQAASPPPVSLSTLFDDDYATVDYDEIKSPGASGGSIPPSGAAADRSSLTSDLYAEISSSIGRGSNRSSTYARVADFSGEAPPPPSVEVLRKLSSSRQDGDDDIPDPGYSKIRVQSRPASVHSTSANNNQLAPGPSSGRRSPLYALVDKSQKSKNRQTVHVDEDISNSVSSDGNMNDIELLYSKVNKGAKGTAHPIDNPPAGGARPKVRDTLAPASSAGLVVPGVGADPGYTTIGSVGELALATSSSHRIKSRKQTTDDGSDYDPNYEKVTDFKQRPEMNGKLRPPRSPQLTEPQQFSPQRRQFPWQGQEHIYQEINEAELESRRRLLKDRAKSTGL